MADSLPNEQQEAMLEKVRRKLDQFDPDDLVKMWEALKKTETGDASAPSPIPGLNRRDWIKYIRKELDRRGIS